MRETHALLKILAISSNNIKQGKIKKAEKAFSDIEKKIKKVNLIHKFPPCGGQTRGAY